MHYFINGLYWGLYLLHEKPDANFQASYRGGSGSDWDVFKHSAIGGVDGAANAFPQVIGTAPIDPTFPLGSTATAAISPYFNCTTLKNYEDLLDLVGIGHVAPNPVPDLTVRANYEAVAAKLDIDDFIKYILLNAVAANQDWPHKNYYASFKRTDPAAKWRFHSWDAEHVFRVETENTFTQGNWGADLGGSGAIMRRIAANAEFRLAFADAIQKYLFNNGILSTAGLQATFAKRFAEIEPMGVRGESARWGDNRSTAGQPYSYTTNGTFATPTWTAEKTRILNTMSPRTRRPRRHSDNDRTQSNEGIHRSGRLSALSHDRGPRISQQRHRHIAAWRSRPCRFRAENIQRQRRRCRHDFLYTRRHRSA